MVITEVPFISINKMFPGYMIIRKLNKMICNLKSEWEIIRKWKEKERKKMNKTNIKLLLFKMILDININ